MAHIGVIGALEDMGIPIDFVGGTSVGAVIATQIAQVKTRERLTRDCREVFVRKRPFRGVTIPMVSLFSPNRMRKLARRAYRGADMEDLWLNCFCVSCDLLTGTTVVHRRGPVWKAVLASSALPGISPPVVDGDQLLVDGGVVDNLPAQTMKELCGGRVILVDVSRERKISLPYSELPSNWAILWSRLSPWRAPIPVPTIGDVLVKSTIVSSLRRREEAHRAASLAIRPPVEPFGLLDFAAFDAIVEIGYRHGLEEIARARGLGLWS